MTLLVTFVLPETSTPQKQAVQPTDSAAAASPATGGESVSFGKKISKRLLGLAALLNRVLIKPFALLAFLRFPAVALTVYLHSVSFGAIYFVNISLEDTFSGNTYSFPQWAVGLVFTPMAVGYLASGLAGGPWTDRIMRRRAVQRGWVDEKGGLVYLPEDRMRENVWLSLILFPLATIWYGWAVQAKVMWVGVVRFIS